MANSPEGVANECPDYHPGYATMSERQTGHDIY